jgi:S-(hydroxymethyl)glutathione dehydrogenase / alcohol dehydrogenase
MPIAMKAAVCHEFGRPLRIENVSLAAPGAGEVEVKMAACAICHSDIFYWEGAWGGQLPAVYGHEAAGIVTRVGSGIRHVKPGDHAIVSLIRSCGSCHYCAQGEQVLCETTFPLDIKGPITSADGKPIVQGLRTGAFAESVVVDASQVVSIPKDIPLPSASLIACGVITGFGAVTNTARVPAGAHVVVIGTGGVGLNTVQGAAVAGARTVMALDTSDAKLEAARRFGATHTHNVKTGGTVEAIKAITGERGADYVFVTVGAKAAFEQAFGYIAKAGTVVVVGMPATGVMAEFDPGTVAAWGQKVIGSKMGSARLALDVPLLIELYRQGRLKLDELITGRYPLEGINDAIDSVKRGEALRNVIVFN